MDKTEITALLKREKRIIDVHTHVGIAAKFYYRYGYPYALSFEDLVIRMKTLGIDHSVVFPFVDSRYYIHDDDSPEVKTTNAFCDFPYELENKNLLMEINEIFPQYSHMALPFLMFDPSREGARQADFMEGLMEKYPVFGLKTASTYIQAFVSDMEAEGRPILELARRKQLPITFHSSVHPGDPWAQAEDIVALAEQNPGVRICIAHTARFLKPVLDKADKLSNCFVDLSAFIIHCKLVLQESESIAEKENRFEADYNNPLPAMQKLAEAYPGTMLWGSDTPFNYWIQKYYTADGKLQEDRLECGYEEEAALMHDLPEDIKTSITYTNNLRFLFGHET